MDEIRYQGEMDRNLRGQLGDRQRSDNLQDLVRGDSQVIGSEKLQASDAMKSQASESAKSSSMEAAQSSSAINRLEGLRQEAITGESLHGMTQQGKASKEIHDIDSRQGALMVESQKPVQEHGSRDGDPPGNPNISSQYLVDHSHKETEIYQQQSQIAHTNTRIPLSTSAVAYPNQNSQRIGNPTELPKQQGTNTQQGHNQGNTLNVVNNSNFDGNLQNVGRRTDSARTN